MILGINIRTAFWGYKKSNIEKHVSSIKSEHDKCISDIKEKIDAVQNCKIQLQQDIDKLNVELAATKDRAHEGERHDILYRLFSRTLKEAAGNEIEAAKKASEEKISYYKNEIAYLKNNYKMIRNKYSTMVKLLENEWGIKEIETIGKQGSFIENKSEDVHLREENKVVGADAQEGKILPFSKNISIQTSNLLQGSDENQSGFWETAVNEYSFGFNSLSVNDTDSKIHRMDDFIKDRNIDNSAKKSIEKENESKNINPVLKSNFWDVTLDEKADVQKVPDKTISAVNQDSMFQQPVTVSTKILDNNNDETALIRNKYIVGKISGETLLDSKGRVIIEKQQVITPEVVEAADREGKLSDLILSMMFPDMG